MKKIILYLIAAAVTFTSCTKKETLAPVSPQKNLGANQKAVQVATVVYIAGCYKALNGHTVAAYWHNNVMVRLSDSSADYQAQSIYVSGPDIYVVGYSTSGIHTSAIYWKNGVSQSLNAGRNSQ